VGRFGVQRGVRLQKQDKLTTLRQQALRVFAFCVSIALLPFVPFRQ
jgi:hypothetical protein